MQSRRRWTAEEDARLRALYPETPMPELLRAFADRTQGAVYGRVYALGLHRSASFHASPASGRIRPGERRGSSGEFRPGHVPANKGLRRPGWGPGRMKETQFRKGERHGMAAQRYCPVGTERLNEDGYRERKVSDGQPFHRRWRFVHLLVWEAAHGPVPKGHAIVFVNGDKTDIRLENLACLSRADLMRRNTVHNYSAPIPQLVQLRGALQRKINRRTRREVA